MDNIDPKFTPPHCAYRSCIAFSGNKLPKDWCSRNGYHKTLAHGKVQRYVCTLCKRTFSRQTFDLHYYEKKRTNWESIRKATVECISDRALARELKCCPTTIAKKLSRYARWALMQQQATLHDHMLNEHLAADGFESFVVSQYYPCHINLLAGTSSQFAYTWDFGFLRRKGTMTPAQKQKRACIEQTWNAYKGDLKNSFTRGVVDPLSHLVNRSSQESTVLFTDQHPEYAKALHQCTKLLTHTDKKTYSHITVSSKQHRDRRNPLFAVNYLDRELRKDLANHVRETTRFAREPNMLMDRVTICLFLHNYSKQYRIKSPKSEHIKHATMAGIVEDRNPELLKSKMNFISRPWWPTPEQAAAVPKTGWEETVERQWRREIPRPHGIPKLVQAQFWLL